MMEKNIPVIIFVTFFIIIVLAVYLGFSGSLCLAQGEEGFLKTELIILYKGESKIIHVSNPTRVVISNPDIADVTSVSKDEILITAKDSGTTNLAWRDNFSGEHSLRLDVFLEDTSLIKERIDNLLKELNLPAVFTRSVDSEGKVMLLGNVGTPQDLERINIALASYKNKLINLIQIQEEEAMVGISIQVLELNKDAAAALTISNAGTRSGVLFKALDVNHAAFLWTLDDLAQKGRARILSQSWLACQSGKAAELLIGGEKPILTTIVVSTTGAQGTKVDYKEFGVKLKIKPTITAGKQIKLALSVEVSDVGAAETIGSSSSPTAKAYHLNKHSAVTELFLNDNQTIVIGGLMGDTPFLGSLFRDKKSKTAGGPQREKSDAELYITLTPNIIKEEVAIKEKAEIETPSIEEAMRQSQGAIKRALVKEDSKTERPKTKYDVQLAEQKEEALKAEAPTITITKEAIAKDELESQAPAIEKKSKKKKKTKARAKVGTSVASLKKEPTEEVKEILGNQGYITTQAQPIPPKKDLQVPLAEIPPVPKEIKEEKESKVKVALEPVTVQEGKPSVSTAVKEALKAEAALTPPKEKFTKPTETFKPETPIPTKEEPKVTISLKGAVSKEKEIKAVVSAVEEAQNQALGAYLAKIAQLIRDNLTYPWIAQQTNMQGSLKLKIHLFHTGELLNVKLIQPSGCALLDDDAIRTVKKIAPYPPFPPKLKLKELRIRLPITYKIE